MDDDDIRARLQRERILSADDHASASTFATLLPSMRAARRRRMTAMALSAAMGLAGTAASALAVRSITTEPTVVVEGSTPPERPSITSVELDGGDPRPTPGSTPRSSERPAATDPGTGRSTVPASTTHGNTAVTSVVVDVSVPPPATDPTSGGTTAQPPTPTTVGPTETTPGPPPASTTTSTTPSTSTSTTTTEPDDDDDDGTGDADLDSTFECDCGTVAVDTVTGELEVRPNSGYSYRLEDVERRSDGTRSQTVQFTGTGEDCELVVPLP